MLPPPQAGPAPVLGPLHQIGAQGVAFDVAHNPVEMLIFLYRETFEAALIDMAASQRMVMSMPTHGMGLREPLREGREFPLPPRPNDEVPMIGHQAIGEQPGRMRLQRLAQHAFKGLVVAIFLKQRQARNGPVQHVIDVTRSRSTGNTGHALTIRTHAAGRQGTRPVQNGIKLRNFILEKPSELPYNSSIASQREFCHARFFSEPRDS